MKAGRPSSWLHCAKRGHQFENRSFPCKTAPKRDDSGAPPSCRQRRRPWRPGLLGYPAALRRSLSGSRPSLGRVDLTDSQEEQLRTFLEEQGSDRFDLRPAGNLPEGYIEAVLLDTEGNETAAKRILFP